LLEMAMIGVFLSLDMFLFYVFWEATLIPMALLIGMYGHERRVYAAVKFFLYTMVASVFMLAAVIWLYTHNPQHNFEYAAFRDVIAHGGFSSTALQWLFLGFFIAFVFLVVGCFLDAIPAIIIFGTILQPLAQSVGMNPIHFAIIGIVSLAFGLVTPPYGLCLMISCAVAKVPIRFALKDTLIMLVPMLLMLAAIIVWPDIPLILPRLIAPELLK